MLWKLSFLQPVDSMGLFSEWKLTNHWAIILLLYVIRVSAVVFFTMCHWIKNVSIKVNPSCVRGPQNTSLTMLSHSWWTPKLFLGCSLTHSHRWTCEQPLALPHRPPHCGLMVFNDDVPLWMSVMVTWMRGGVSSTMQWFIGGSKATFDLGKPPLPFHPIITCGPLGKCLWSGV